MYRIIFFTFLIWIWQGTELMAQNSHQPALTPQEHKALYNAQKSIEGKNFQNARQILSSHIRENPNKLNPLIFLALGNAWYMDGNIKEAYNAYEKGYSLSAASYELCINLAKVSYDLEKYEKAGDLFEKAFQLSQSHDPELLYQSGAAYYKAKAFDKGKSVLERLVKSKTSVKDSWLMLLMHTCLEMNAWKSAEPVLEDFLRKNPGDAAYWKLLAQIRLRQNNYQDAASALEILYRIEAPSKKELEELANLYFQINLPLKALRSLQKAYGKNLNVRECEMLFKASVQAQRVDEAVHYLDMAVQMEPGASWLLEKGKLFYQRGDWNKAIQSFQACLKINPSHELCNLLLGYCAVEKEDFSLARKAFSTASKGTSYRQEATAALNALNVSIGED